MPETKMIKITIPSKINITSEKVRIDGVTSGRGARNENSK